MKRKDVFANEMVLLGRGIGLDPIVEIGLNGLAVKRGFLDFNQVFKTGVIANRRIQPNIKIFIRRVGNLEAKIRRVTRDVFVREFVFITLAEPFAHFIGRLGLCQTLHPVAQKCFATRIRHREEVVHRGANFRRCARDGGVRFNQFSR